jgi:hypothetical protein
MRLTTKVRNHEELICLVSGHSTWSHRQDLEGGASETNLYFGDHDMESQDPSSQECRNANQFFLVFGHSQWAYEINARPYKINPNGVD